MVEWTRRAQAYSSDDTVSKAAETLRGKLSAIESELIQVDYKGARDRLDLPVKLNRKLAELASVVASADFSPPCSLPDLTRNDVATMQVSGGPITKDTSGAETYGTIFALVESPHEQFPSRWLSGPAALKPILQTTPCPMQLKP